MTKQEALEAAKLAKIVGSQLGTIDKLMIDPSRSANQIDLNKFISQVVQPNGQQQNTNIPRGYVSEELVRKIVPDIPQQNQPIQEEVHQERGQQQVKRNNKIENTTNFQVEDKTLKKIATSLERISKAYEKYVDYIVVKGDVTKVLND
jgi:RecJ-like exonuclease